MPELIDQEIFDHLVNLAALELDVEEAIYLRQELNNQLQAIQELAAIPIQEDIPITSHGITFTSEISMPVREDELKPYTHQKEIIAQAPETEDGYFVVPDIPHEDLE